MKTPILSAWLLLLSFGFVYLAFFKPDTATEEGGPELAVLMARQQYLVHKLGESVRAENRDLMAFYAHELHESTDGIIHDVDTYDGFKIADLTRSILLPDLERMEAVIPQAPISDIRMAFSRLVQSCNACHATTDHSYIIITETLTESGFNQVF